MSIDNKTERRCDGLQPQASPENALAELSTCACADPASCLHSFRISTASLYDAQELSSFQELLERVGQMPSASYVVHQPPQKPLPQSPAAGAVKSTALLPKLLRKLSRAGRSTSKAGGACSGGAVHASGAASRKVPQVSHEHHIVHYHHVYHIHSHPAGGTEHPPALMEAPAGADENIIDVPVMHVTHAARRHSSESARARALVPNTLPPNPHHPSHRRRFSYSEAAPRLVAPIHASK
ncbi:hypothetical protein L7F22_010335 [Adiantum nelumboides]|nr:hypothetical protein [Adiantum nelumboides]